jgi:hypothetical protein
MPKDKNDARLLREPIPVEETPWVVALDHAVAVTLATGLVFTVVGAVLMPTPGARRSTRLVWKARSAEIEAAIAADPAR